jgi:hypothetical protein
MRLGILALIFGSLNGKRQSFPGGWCENSQRVVGARGRAALRARGRGAVRLAAEGRTRTQLFAARSRCRPGGAGRRGGEGGGSGGGGGGGVAADGGRGRA